MGRDNVTKRCAECRSPFAVKIRSEKTTYPIFCSKCKERRCILCYGVVAPEYAKRIRTGRVPDRQASDAVNFEFVERHGVEVCGLCAERKDAKSVSKLKQARGSKLDKLLEKL